MKARQHERHPFVPIHSTGGACPRRKEPAKEQQIEAVLDSLATNREEGVSVSDDFCCSC